MSVQKHKDNRGSTGRGCLVKTDLELFAPLVHLGKPLALCPFLKKPARNTASMRQNMDKYLSYTVQSIVRMV